MSLESNKIKVNDYMLQLLMQNRKISQESILSHDWKPTRQTSSELWLQCNKCLHYYSVFVLDHIHIRTFTHDPHSKFTLDFMTCNETIMNKALK